MSYLLRRLALTTVLFGVIPVALFFGLAGRWDLWNVWAVIGITFILFAFQAVTLYFKDPDLLREQARPAGHELPGRRRLQILSFMMSFLSVCIAGLDQRFHWSDVIPVVGVLAGIMLTVLGIGLYTWATFTNSFFSFMARSQADRGQRVVSEGPYAIVRHPGYAGLVLSIVASGIAFNSVLSIIPAVIAVLLFTRITAIEDRMLHDELAGYANYAAKVRYRLIPGVW